MTISHNISIFIIVGFFIMADEKRENDNENKGDENDPYKFFKFAGPVNNDDDKDKDKRNKKKPKISFFTILLILF